MIWEPFDLFGLLLNASTPERKRRWVLATVVSSHQTEPHLVLQRPTLTAASHLQKLGARLNIAFSEAPIECCSPLSIHAVRYRTLVHRIHPIFSCSLCFRGTWTASVAGNTHAPLASSNNTLCQNCWHVLIRGHRVFWSFLDWLSFSLRLMCQHTSEKWQEGGGGRKRTRRLQWGTLETSGAVLFPF